MCDESYGVIRILHMIGSLEMGGSQMMVLNIYKAIDRARIQFDFMIDHSDATMLVQEVEALGAKVYTMPQFRGYNVCEVRKAWDAFFDTHKEYKILHSHVRSYASIYLPIAKKHGVKTIIHSHSTSNGRGLTSIVKKILQYPLRYQADYLFACSVEAGEWLYGKKAIRKENFIVIYNGIDCERFKYNKEDREQIRKKYGIENNFVVGHVGRHTASKNPFFLIEVFSELYNHNSNARLLQVGAGELSKQMREECRELGIEDVVIFAGEHNEVEKYYSAMDVFLFPSLWEGLGIAVVEAQVSGLHCLVSKEVPALADINAGLFHSIDLQKPIGEWANAALSFMGKERSVTVLEKIRQSGFDSRDTARYLTYFYTTLTKQ